MKTIALFVLLMASPEVVVVRDCIILNKFDGRPYTSCGKQIITDQYGREYEICQCQWLIKELGRPQL